MASDLPITRRDRRSHSILLSPTFSPSPFFRLPVLSVLVFFRFPHSDFRIQTIPTSEFIPFPFNLPFPQDFIHHGLGVGGRVGTGTVAAHMGGGLAFYDLQAIGVRGKFSQTFGIGA
jgi:hypothetical protein